MARKALPRPGRAGYPVRATGMSPSIWKRPWMICGIGERACSGEVSMRRTVVACLVGLLAPALARGFDVTECGQAVPSRETGVLQVDLTGCPSSAVGVFLSDKSELDLNGHAVASGAI